jgi:hypothetical protein
MEEELQEVRDMLLVLTDKVRKLTKLKKVTLAFLLEHDTKSINFIVTPDNQSSIDFNIFIAKASINKEL